MKTKNHIRKYYYCRKTRHIIKDCFKKISDMKNKNNSDGSSAVAYKEEPDI